MRKISLFLLVVVVLFTGCKKRLDSFLFNNDNNIDAYYLDSYSGDSELDLPNSFYVPEEQIHQFEYTILDEGEELSISAIFVGEISAIATDTVILYCHGNKGNMDNYWPRQKLLSHVGGQGNYGVLMFDYPGYGLSEGQPTEKNMYAATGGAIHWLKGKGLTEERFVMYGYSLGSAPTSKAVGDKPFELVPNKIILEAPFASSEVMVEDAAVLNMPASYFVNLKIDNAEQMKKCSVPLYWIHGIDDDFLSFDTHGAVVYKNHIKSWKLKSAIEGASHSNVPTFMGYEAYISNVYSFILKNN
ncbi:hypothetical protein CW751_12260 [Brumimicrobium salinarum]|uniref:AB hydrolase-1 domain-containing protein n=1 Tax=Brumimicrobium salinarum TaxID=2058658 RepID=A0A2I0R074_9FLAO|nr:alpha/beta fold hydrolase [Brumimicrobium salinarum]PKR79991.1 hypothetical protein CW751_12260 [Brumimicrobium salinarum]